MKGAGRYDQLTEALVASTGADAVFIIVRGDKFSGSSLSVRGDAASGFPTILRTIADQMDLDLARAGRGNAG